MRLVRKMFVLVILLLITTVHAQTDPAVRAEAIDVEDLKLRLTPRTDEQLREDLDWWKAILSARLEELAELQVVARAEDAPEGTADEITEAQGQVASVMDRFELTAAQLELKGGDITADAAYLAAVKHAGAGRLSAEQLRERATEWLSSPEGGLQLLERVSLFLAVLIASWIVARIVARIVRKATSRVEQASELLRDFLVRLTRKVVMLIGLVVAISMLGVNIGPLIAAIGAAGFIIGFAVQGTLSNFASGLMILIYQPFDVGDFVNVAGVVGKVEAMTVVSTTLKTPDNQTVILPNNTIWGDVITNITANDTRRVDLVFGIGYGDDIECADGILRDVVGKHPGVLDEPEPVVEVHELADSSVNFVVRPWAKTEDYWDVYWQLTRQVKQRFDAEGISIPFPQMDVHVQQAG